MLDILPFLRTFLQLSSKEQIQILYDVDLMTDS